MKAAGLAPGQLPAQGDGFLDGGQGPGPAPTSLRRLPRLFSDPARSGVKAAGLSAGQLPVQGDGFLDGGQRPGPVADLAAPAAEVVQTTSRGRG